MSCLQLCNDARGGSVQVSLNVSGLALRVLRDYY